MPAQDLIGAYTAWQRSESRSQRTIDDRRAILTRMDHDLPLGLDLACEEELKEWLWQDGWSMSTRETYYGAFSDFFRWALANEYLDFDPAVRIARPIPPQRLPNPVTDEELAEALGSARQPFLLHIILAAYAGMRCIDIANTVRERITQQSIKIIESKGGAARVVPTHPIVWEAVKDLPPGPLTDLNARQISVSGANYLQRTLGLRGVRMHRFRHWFGTMVQRLHKDLLVTQQLMGHKDPKTTAGYALVASESKRAAIDLLPVFAAGPWANTTVGPAGLILPQQGI